ncbi:MAG: hypothetical protein FWC55_09740 [Firmicutes bacterium]|nr:hypothetical protein [Bacillota bacterium]
MDFKRVTIFAGHYGSGKTTVAVNCALSLAKSGAGVSVCDADIVNPYFRVHDFKALLEDNGAEVISSVFANTNLDVPAVPAGLSAVFDRPDRRFIIDLGGDERGALALGRHRDRLNGEKSLDMLLVFNTYRPLSSDVAGLLEIKNEIEAASGVRFTGIVNNANLGRETQTRDLEATFPTVKAASEALGLPVIMTAVKRALYEECAVKLPEAFPMDVFFPWEDAILGTYNRQGM